MGVFRTRAAVEALANNAHGVLVKKRDQKGSDVELWQESAYDSDSIELHTGLYVPVLQYMEKL